MLTQLLLWQTPNLKNKKILCYSIRYGLEGKSSDSLIYFSASFGAYIKNIATDIGINKVTKNMSLNKGNS